MSVVTHLIKRALARAGWVVYNTRYAYVRDGLYTVHNDHFRRDPAFRSAYRRGQRASNGFDPAFEWRVHIALWAAATSLRAPGDFVECGVNAGFMSSAIMHDLRWHLIDRRYYLIDTFSGPVLAHYSPEEVAAGRRKIAEDALAAGAYVTDLERARGNCLEWPNAVIVQGVVPDVLSTLNIGAIAFLHLDMNCAYPERAALEYFWDRISDGGVVLLDDYAYTGCDQQTGALDAAARSFGARVVSLPTGQGMIIK